LDNPPYFTLKNNKHRIKMTEKIIGHKFKILTESQFKNTIQTNPDYCFHFSPKILLHYYRKLFNSKHFNSKHFNINQAIEKINYNLFVSLLGLYNL
jgi:hypothetical protein